MSLQIFSYKIINHKTGLEKLITSFEYGDKDLLKIIRFYDKHSDYSISLA